MKIPVNPPLQYEDYDLSFIEIDMSKLTTMMQIQCDKIYKRRISAAQMMMMSAPYLDPEYRRIVASKLTGLPETVILKLPLKAYNILITEVMAFFGDLIEDDTDSPLMTETREQMDQEA